MNPGEKYTILNSCTVLTVGDDGWLYSDYGPISEDLMRQIEKRDIAKGMRADADELLKTRKNDGI